MKYIFITIIKIYKNFISPYFPPRCRFYPTCSEYGIQSLSRHGTLMGLWFLLLRISKCHPFHVGGYDPVKE
jgi:putative membrane protein insertion efficiency factor